MAVLSSRGVNTGRSVSDVPSGTRGRDVSQREDLANFISMITRDETPFMSSIGKTKATAIYHEWQTDQLQAPGNSIIGEGTDYILPTGISAGQDGTFGAGTADNFGAEFATTGPDRHRLGNYTQINGKTIAVSGTRRAIDQAGVADEYAYQLKKRGTELRRDVEFDLIHSFHGSGPGGVASTAASLGAARTMAGYQAWINRGEVLETNTSLGGNVRYVGQWQAPAAPGVGTNAPTVTGVTDNTGIRSSLTTAADPDRGALSLSDIDSVMQTIYQNGGKATKIMVSPKLRRDFSDLMVTDSGVRRNIDMDGKLRQSVDIYMSDFGDLMVVPNYIMGLTNNVVFRNSNGTPARLTNATNVADFSAFIYDPQWFALATLRPMQEVDVGQRGDSTIGMMIEEMTLEVKNPQGCGAIYGLE